MLNIYSFLDFHTIIKQCRLVCKQWLEYSHISPLFFSTRTQGLNIPYQTFPICYPTINRLELINQCITYLPAMPNVTHLRLSECDFKFSSTFYWLSDGYFPLLTSLDVSNNHLNSTSSMGLFKEIESLSNLKLLNMSGLRKNDNKFLALVKSPRLQHLTCLDLSFSFENTYSLSKVLLAIADNEHLSNLTYLNTLTEIKYETHDPDLEVAINKILQSPHVKKLNSFANDLSMFNNCSLDACRYFGTNIRAFKYLPTPLLSNRQVIMSAFESDGLLLQYTPEQVRNYHHMVMLAVCNNGLALKYASTELQNDWKIVMAAVSNNGHAIEYASQEMKNDKSIILAAVRKNGQLLRYASDTLRNDKEVVVEAVSNNEHAIEHASLEVRNDKSIMLDAVRRNGRILQYTSEDLRNDKEVVMAAVNHWGKSIQYASEKLRCDKEIALIALSKTREVLDFIPENLFSPTEIETIVGIRL